MAPNRTHCPSPRGGTTSSGCTGRDETFWTARGPSPSSSAPTRSAPGVRACLGISGGDGVADLVDHRLFALADLLGSKAHEAAILGRFGGCLRGRDQPLAEGFGLLRSGTR